MPHDFLEEKPQVVSTHHHYTDRYLRKLPWIYNSENWGAHFGGPSNHEKQGIDGAHSDASHARQPGHICFHKVGNVRCNLLSLTMLACSVPPGHIEVARLSKIFFFITLLICATVIFFNGIVLALCICIGESEFQIFKLNNIERSVL